MGPGGDSRPVFLTRTPGADGAYTGIQAVFRLNPDKGVDAYAAFSRLGRPRHRLYFSHDHIGGRHGVFLFRGAPAQISKGHAGLCRRGHDGGFPTGATQNVKDLLSSPEIENILENSDFIYLLNLSAGDRKLMTERLNISAEQLAYVTNADPGSGLLFFQNVILPFRDEFPKDTELYKLLTTKPSEVAHDGKSG